jgi:predicted cupin superfamily sugar epimerase
LAQHGVVWIDLRISAEGLPNDHTRGRAASTVIYFLLNGDDLSAFDHLRSDGTWHFYVGGTLKLHIIDDAGQASEMAF